jgi:hypothetical protein
MMGMMFAAKRSALALLARSAERLRLSHRVVLHRYVPAAVRPSLRLILITVCACHLEPGRSVSTLRRLSSAAIAVALISTRSPTMSSRIGLKA